MSKPQRLDKLLSNAGYGTRTELKKLLKSGRVKVKGEVEKDPGRIINPPFSDIDIDGRLFIYKEYIYLMMNKPQGVISATEDKREKTVIELLPDNYKRYSLFPAGRLDKDTEGLLILTDDGMLAHNMLSPSKHISKTYYAEISGVVTEKDITAFLEGVVIDGGYKCLPAQLDIIESGSRSRIELTIHEGKFHQVKRMFESIGKKVIFLKRISMGNLKLDESLKPGEFRELKEDEVKLLTEK